VLGKDVCKFISAYAPQAGLDIKQKENFFDALSDVMLKIKGNESLFVGGNFNDHVGRDSKEFIGIHGGFGVGEGSTEGVWSLDNGTSLIFCIGLYLHVAYM